MHPTRSLVLSSAASTAVMLAAYGIFRAAGQAPSSASLHAAELAPVAFIIAVGVIIAAARPLSAAASAAIVGAGAAMIGTLFAASRTADMFGLLLVGFVLGVGISVFALTKDLDVHASPKVLLFVPMAQLCALLWVFGL